MSAPPLELQVLLIEDSSADEELILRALARDEISVIARRVDEPSAVRAAIASCRPDIILSDYAMPGFGGPDALRLARQLAPDIPFVFVSGTIGEERAIQAIREGATDYVLKDNLRRLGPAVRRAVTEARERIRVRIGERERERLAGVLEATSDFVAMFGPDGRIAYVNAAASRLGGEPEGALIGRPVLDLFAPRARPGIEREGLPAVKSEGRWSGDTSLLAADGSEVPVSQVMIAQHDPDGRFAYGSIIARDIRERVAYEARIRFTAHHDALTGLPNRTLLEDRAAQGLAHARRVGRLAAILVVDIDRFKLVNDTYGHRAGDRLLRWVGDRLSEAVGEGDTVARLGGDAFAVLATDLEAPDAVVELSRRISGALTASFDLEGSEFRVVASIGAAVFPRDGNRLETLLKNADAAMHRAKAEAGHFSFYADRMTSEMAERMELGNDLRTAIERSEVEVHFQPQADLALNRATGVEALLRWKHPRRGWIDPSRFIPIAEDLSLIGALGDYALNEGCRRLREWDRAGAPRLRLAINASARQFRGADFLDSVGGVLERFGLEPERLEIELTESVLLNDPDETAALLARFKDLGVRIAIDDFGTGYSSLSYLSRLPVDGLKIDRAFVHRIRRRGRDAAIVQAIISLAHSLGMRVVAEGVETPDELAFLRKNGCEEIQGSLYSRPLVPDQIPAFARGAQGAFA